jgi:hypothetical protein
MQSARLAGLDWCGKEDNQMKRKILAVAFLAFVPLLSNAQDTSPLHISSLDTAFGVQVDFEGELLLFPEWVEVRLTNSRIYVSEKCPYQGRRQLSRLSIGLGRKEQKSWKIVSRSNAQDIDLVMRPGEGSNLGDLTFFIPRDRIADLSGHWLVVQVEGTSPDAILEKELQGYFFAHSRRDIFVSR